MEAQSYLMVAASYALVGVAISALYYLSPKARVEPAVHLLTVPLIALATGLVVLSTSLEFQALRGYHQSMQFYTVLAASLCYAPIMVFLILHYWEVLIEAAMSPARKEKKPAPPRGEKQIWLAIKSRLEVLAARPGDVRAREELGDLYATLGYYESAAFEYRKAADWLERGYAQSHLLYKAAYLCVEKKKDVEGAVILLRRIVRLYPRSYFAAYSRRILNQYQAHSPEKKPFTPPRSQP